MKRTVLTVLAVVCLWVGSASATPLTEIYYETTDLGAGRWQYTYDVHNVNLNETIEEFTIWFAINDYDNLVIETQDPPASSWDELVWQPEPLFDDDGGYDALATGLNILPGESVHGFSVSFDWLGIGAPRTQYYEIIDPVTFNTIEDGYTVPEPATLFIFMTGISFIPKKMKGSKK